MAKQSRPPSFLLTRPAAQGDRFAQALTKRFGPLDIISSPLIAPEFLSARVPERDWSGLIFTSETGVEGYRRLVAQPSLSAVGRAFCVGDRTAAAATAAGLQAVSAGGDAAALCDLVRSCHMRGPLLHLRGEDTRGDLSADLNSAGIETESVVVYRQSPLRLSEAATRLLQGNDPVVAPLFSPRTAALFVAECLRIGVKARLGVVAISANAARELQPLPGVDPVVAKRPDADAMLEAVAKVLARLADA